MLLAALAAASAAAMPAAPAYGSPEFRPTPERPIGFQGDGNGHFPGASLVSEFWEGWPVMREVEVQDGGNERKERALVYGDRVPKNILWKTELPG